MKTITRTLVLLVVLLSACAPAVAMPAPTTAPTPTSMPATATEVVASAPTPMATPSIPDIIRLVPQPVGVKAIPGLGLTGRLYAVIARTSSQDTWDLYVLDSPLATLEEGINLTKWVEDEVLPATAPVWSPDGQKIAFTNEGAPGLCIVDLTHGSRDVFDIRCFDIGGLNPTDISWVGSSIVFVVSSFGTSADCEDSRVYTLDTTTFTTQEFTDLPGSQDMPVWSPDGGKLMLDNYCGQDVLSVFTAAGKWLREFDGASSDNAVWSSDGTRLAYGVCPDTLCDLYIYDFASGTNQKQTLNLSFWYPAWSPDGVHIAFASHSGESGMYVLNVQTLVVQQIAQSNWGGWATDPQWVDNGTLLFIRGGDHYQPAVVKILN